jgi:rubrerythrin
MSNTKIDEILDFAIKNEEEAYEFYLDLVGKVKSPNMKKVFEDFAHEEARHKTKLEAVKRGTEFKAPAKQTMDLKIADYVVPVAADTGGEFDYQSALAIAMQKEKAAFKLYMDLAGQTDDEAIKELFLTLAQEEAKHKLRFELEYDEQIFAEN